MTQAQLSALVVSWLDDANQTYFVTSNVNTWLNMAQRKVQFKLLQAGSNWYMKPVETLSVVGQMDYLLPTDCLVVHRLEAVISGTVGSTSENRQPIVRITANQQDLVSIQSGNPTNYYLKKDRLTLSPTPSTTQTLRLYYSARVADMVNPTDSADVPEQYSELVAVYAAFDGFIKDDRTPENLVLRKNEFELMLQQTAVDRAQDHSRRVVQVNDDYSGGSWY